MSQTTGRIHFTGSCKTWWICEWIRRQRNRIRDWHADYELLNKSPTLDNAASHADVFTALDVSETW